MVAEEYSSLIFSVWHNEEGKVRLPLTQEGSKGDDEHAHDKKSEGRTGQLDTSYVQTHLD